MNKLKIGPLTYNIKYIKDGKLHSELEWEDPEDDTAYYGAVSHKNQTIFISKENSEERERLALLHEVIHAVSEQYGMDLTEGQVIGVTNGVVDVMDRNTWLKKKLWS